MRHDPNCSSRGVDVALLVPESVDRAFALLQHALPDVTLHDWRDFVREQHAATGDRPAHRGILVARDRRGVILGLAIFQHLRDLRHHQVLQVDLCVVLDLLHRQNVAERLIAELEARAEHLACQAVHFALPRGLSGDNSEWMASLLTDRGHIVESRVFCKRIDPAGRT